MVDMPDEVLAQYFNLDTADKAVVMAKVQAGLTFADLVSSGGVPNSTLTAYFAADVTNPATAVNFDAPLIESDDMTINEDGDLEFITAGLYQITLNPYVMYDGSAAGFSLVNTGDAGGTDYLTDNFFYNGNNQLKIPTTVSISLGELITYPPTWFDEGNTWKVTLGWALLSAGTVTFGQGSMLYVARLA